MKKLFFLFFFIISFLSIISYSLYMRVAHAQIPPPTVSCEDWESPEFAYLRPYQASPCGGGTKMYYCGNRIIIYEEVQDSLEGGTEICTIDHKDVNVPIDKTYIINMKDLELPIAGNTEETKNYAADDIFDDPTKMNEYISWYLSGVNNKAEYGSDKNDPDTLVNFSGPVQKLLSWYSLAEERINSVNSLSEKAIVDSDDPNAQPEQIRHNQIVVCAEKTFGIFGRAKPVPCPDGKEYRLKDWEGHLPPLPWDEKYQDNPEGYKKDLCDWRGGTYIQIPFTNIGTCAENLFKSNEWADLFAYIPLSSTEDTKSKLPIVGADIKAMNDTIISPDDPDYEILDEAALYYPHTVEDFELSEILNSTFIPNEGTDNQIDYKTVETDTDPATKQCRLIDVRTNEGDNLFAEVDPNSYDVKVQPYTIETIPCNGSCDCQPVECEDDPNTIPNECQGVQLDEYCTKGCSGGTVMEIRTITKITNAREIFANTTAGASSAFRRIFPKIEEGAPVECIANIPTVTKAQYIGSSITSGSYAGNQTKGSPKEIIVEEPNKNRTDGTDANLYFPYFGSVYEYFLKGIQTALRPKGYGEPITQGDCGGPECGVLPPNLPKASGSCSLGSYSSRVGDIPDSLIQIIEAAAQTYNTPPDLILGIMYGEGLFDGNNKKDWTEEHVLDWATCNPVPDCNETGDDNFLGFNGNDFQNIVPYIAPDIATIDPNRYAPSQCNLLDAIYALAWNLHDSADGGEGLPLTCFGIDLHGNVPSSCSWDRENYASAIKVAGSGYGPICLTNWNSCITGGGLDAACMTGGDTCETVQNRNYKFPSHFGCVWDVAHGQ